MPAESFSRNDLIHAIWADEEAEGVSEQRWMPNQAFT